MRAECRYSMTGTTVLIRRSTQFPRGYNPSSAKLAGIMTKSSPEGLHDFAVAEVGTPYGNTVRAYDTERTLCDMLRGTAFPDLQLFSPAMRAYLSSKGRNLPKLQSYSEKLGSQER